MSDGWFAATPMSGGYFSEHSVEFDAPGMAGIVGPPVPDPGRQAELADIGRLARRGLKKALTVARADESPTPGGVVRDFLGDAVDSAEIVQESWASYEGVNVQRAVDAWVARSGAGHRLLGIQSMNEDASLGIMLMRETNHYSATIANVSRTNLPAGPDGFSIACLRYGLHLVETTAGDPTSRVVLFQALANPMRGRPQTTVEILAADRGVATRVGRELRDLSRELNVFRGQVLTFGGDMFGYGDSVLQFHRRPTMTRADLVLDERILAAIERQVAGIAGHREALLRAGQHLKRGLLLYGPPGVGKTHTIRYLMSTLPDVTVIQVSGNALQLVAEACSAARSLAPSIVVVEDVDLIAEDRGMNPGEHPMLFQLLNEMDGVEGDADVAFILTTNRADLLEPALAARPGRIDEAVEIDLPDLDARRRLFDLYRADLVVNADDARIDAALTRAEGVTASFLKELLRRTALTAAERTTTAPDETPLPEPGVEPDHTPLTGTANPGPLTATADDLDAALDGLLDTRSRMTRVLLGSAAPNETLQTLAEPWPPMPGLTLDDD